ncbi:MAG: type I restriction endonuclease subunit R, partial [Neisseriaceae bacterium]|nr:type I restriction endonuclease subunit R [Neisseriaceae bacterium]
MSRQFSENTRVQIPALLHLTRLGYQYVCPNVVRQNADPDTGILRDIFDTQIKALNPSLFANETTNNTLLTASLLEDIKFELRNDDLGKAFFERLHNLSGSLKLIDFEHFHKNAFHITFEQSLRNGEDAFRPDITVFINGIPLAMIEVKKPNNKDGLKAEYERMNERLRNEKFRRFLNEFQLFIFSNNQEYEDDDPEHLVGAYYATNGEKSLRYNHFREELPSEVINDIAEIDADTEQRILSDNRCPEIYHNNEYQTNKRTDTPTNRLLTGLFHRDRLRFLLKHGIVYVKEQNEKTGEIHLQKHIMRYPQLFAAKQTLKTLDAGKKHGVIWHTQGSGKTAFAFYCVSILTEYFAQKQIVPKFYFLVDRLDLANQAAAEFEKRGLRTYRINSRDELVQHFKQTEATRSGQREICVLNIQKFVNDATAINETGYQIDIQRIFFIDEAHRSYKPQGSFLPNLFNADKNAIRIALTGTPLIVPNGKTGWLNRFATKEIFGDYIHKYYYDRSILDGYTLKLMREKIKTSYIEEVQQAIEDIQIHKGDISLQEIHEHPKYYTPLLDYIVTDFNRSRRQFANNTIGAMVICHSNKQAERLFQLFQQKYATQNSAILILHDYGNEESRKKDIQQFKDGKIDFVFVDEMLITGFDCPRLKKLYLERKIKAHNLLQALTRVNRPYQNFRFGFV